MDYSTDAMLAVLTCTENGALSSDLSTGICETLSEAVKNITWYVFCAKSTVPEIKPQSV